MNKTTARLMSVLAALLMAVPLLADTNAQEVEEDQSLATTLVTPHKVWAKPYAGGPVRALFIVSGGSYSGTWFSVDTRFREPVELLQRFQMKGDAILVGSSGKPDTFLGGTLGHKRAERLLSQPYDLYILANMAMENLPARFQFLMMEQVAKGAGLVCCGVAAREFMVAKRRLNPVPEALTAGLPTLDGKAPADVLQAFKLGKGRGVWLNYPAWALTPSQHFSYRRLAEYDYRMLLVGRAALWAASREGELRVAFGRDGGRGTGDGVGSQAGGAAAAAAGQPSGLAPRPSPLAPSVTLTNGGTQPLAVRVALELRRAEDGRKWPLGEVPVSVAPGKPAAVPVRLPQVRAGDYFVDAVVKSARGVEACGAMAVPVSTEFGVEKVELDHAYVERGETIGGKVALRGEAPAGSILRLRFRDNYDRIIRQQNLPVKPGQAEYPFTYRTDPFSTVQVRAEALLVAGGREIEMKDASFTVPKRRRGQFNFLQWDAPGDVLGYYAWRRLQDAGQNVCLMGSFGESKPHSVLLACDASTVPYSTRILDPKDDNGFMKPVCWNHEPAATEHVQKIVSNQQKWREQGVFVYSLGDEGVTLGCCVHPSCIAAYRRYLQGQYGTIEKLNESWGTQYPSFDEVDLLDRKDNMESAAVGKGMYARWFDRQAFARVNLMQFSGRFVNAYKKLDPTALTGFEGTGGFGDDYDTILGTNTFYSPYPGIGDDIVRSAAPREIIRANWMGYSKTADALSDAAWRMVIKGMDSVWFWMWTGIGDWRGYLNPALDFWPATAELNEEMRPVREGLGDLLIHSKMTHSGVGIFYSVASAISGGLGEGRTFSQPETTHLTWTRLTYEVGQDFRYVTSAMLKQGVLDAKGFRVLLLPMTQAISPDEAQAIRRFVEAGGVVIADVRPGVFDGHCKPTAPGLLDDLFGIRRAGDGKGVRGSVALKATLGKQALDVSLKDVICDPGVEAAGAQVLVQGEKAPLLLVNKVGAGRAVLLNFQLVVPKPDDAQADAARRLVKALYDNFGVRNAIAATDPKGGPLPLTETRAWRNGNAVIFGLWRQMQCAWFGPKTGTVAGAPQPARILLPAPRHVYDLRARKYLGSVKQIDTRLRWGRASFFAALPYAIGGVDVKLSSAKPAPGSVVDATIRLRIPAGAKEQHAICVKVYDPQGREQLWGRQVLLLENGTGHVRVPAAYNDAPGKWRLRATDLFSSQSAEATWTVAGTRL